MKRLTSLILAALCVVGMVSMVSATGGAAAPTAVEQAKIQETAYEVIDD